MAVHTKAFNYPVAEHWEGNRNVQPREDSNRHRFHITNIKTSNIKMNNKAKNFHVFIPLSAHGVKPYLHRM